MARIICFVCGSQGAEHRLRIKACDSEPYFPFLEHHDPPKGSRLPSKEGIVDSCRVCSAFLCQQWEAYERSHTPAIKRLYWLKRADNGHFTGAEMRLQGEYIAQIMGLQYQPGAFDGRTSPSDFGRERGLREVPQQVRVDRKSADIAREKKNVQFSSTAVQPKTVASIPTNVPLYSSENRSQVVTQKPVPSEGVLDLSVTKKSDTSNTATDDKKQILLCFLCANQISLYDSKVVNSVRQSISEPYFPIIQTIPCIPGALPLNDNGQTRVCVACKNSLFQQWQAYEMSGIPNQHRNYKVFESQELKIIRANAASLTRMHSVELSQARLEHVCYICGNMYPAELIRSLFTSPSTEPSMGTLFFPFVRELSRPAGAEPLRSDGSVLACRNCYEALYKQWQLQEMERVPLAQRQYSLSFLGNKPDLLDSSFRLKQLKDEPILKGRESPKPDLNKPLNIQISENSSEQADTLLASQGLLAIASSGSTNQGDGNEPPKSKSPVKVNKSPSVDSFAKTVPHPLLQATKIPKKICFLCGEKCRLSKAHVLCSYPPRHEAKTMNNQVIPFFPFLANKEPAPKAETMTEDGTVISCDVCFHILIQQWNDYEENKGGNDSNRWLRKYTLPDFVCCLCSKWMKHKNIQLLSCKMYPFLKDIKPNTAPTIEDGLTVGVCTMCAQNLNMQNIEYERMGVPVELRKFNWTKQKELQAQNDDSSDEEEICQVKEQMPREITKLEATDETSGSGQNVKPPPLNMLGGSSKLSRNTATVPPLNQTSPSNGLTSISSNAALNATRTSSFAAALRKLAHQAKDPEETPPKHGSQPGSSTTSPRSTTPKRGPPPLVYTSHSSLNSPPVVTIAPTQSHGSLVSSDSRQALERTHSMQSVSSAYDGLSSLKMERPTSTQSGREEDRYRPQSSHSSRDDDRMSSKDVTSRRTPLSAQSSTSPAVTREESLMRGFQPYRPGDDLRHSLPSFGLDPAAYPYPAFLPPHAFPHPAFRFDDPLLLERYRMMQPQYIPFTHPGMLPPPGALNPFLTGRYPPELLHQQLPFVSQSSRLPDLSPSLLERQRLEEERLRDLEKEQREKEKEAILLREKERAREREKEYDKLRESMSHEHRSHSNTELRVPHHSENRSSSSIELRTPQYDSKKIESRDRNHNERGSAGNDSVHRSEGHKFGSITHGTPREYNLNEKNSREYHHSSDNERFKHLQREKMDLSRQSHQDVAKHHSHHHEKLGGHQDHRDKKYSLLHSGQHDKNRSTSESESRLHGKSNDIFRPFDTSNLTNGYLPPNSSYDSNDVNQGRLSKDNTSAHKHSSLPKPGGFNLHHVIDASKMHYKEHHSEHLKSNEKKHNLVSTLDVGEQKLRQRRIRGELSDDSEMDEIIDYLDESHKQSLMMVTRGPPLALDASKEKMTFLQQLGLTSQKVKRDLEYRKIRRRRRRHREPSVSPVVMEDGEEKPISMSSKVGQEVLCPEPDYRNKCSFLGAISLGTVESEKKKGSGVKRRNDRKSDEASGKKAARGSKTDKVKLFPSKSGDKTLSQDFAQEFHNSVLQSTQKHINGRLGNEQGESSQTISVDGIPRWPGIDILMESYQKYQEEYKLEKTMLQERCRKLQSTNTDLNKKAEDFSKRMSESIEKKKKMEEDRVKNQRAITTLKQMIKDLK